MSYGNGVERGKAGTNPLKDHQARFGVVGSGMRIAESDPVMATQIGELPSALAPLVEVPIEDENVDHRSEVAALGQRGESQATTERINHREVVGDVHAHNDVVVGPVRGEAFGHEFNNVCEGRGIDHHLVGDPVNSRRPRWNGHPRVYKAALHDRLESTHPWQSFHKAVRDRYVGEGINARRFEIETYESSHWRAANVTVIRLSRRVSTIGDGNAGNRCVIHHELCCSDFGVVS
ncbi:MAG TPA: hypothetical protein VG246_09415 [Acidimicrobiales bacterium]|nr:hypothetical protein [Acidimicrobiales bacterium]